MRNVGRIIGSVSGVSGLLGALKRRALPRPGSSAGIDKVLGVDVAPAPGQVRITCTDISPARVEEVCFEEVESFLKSHARPDWSVLRWVNVEGLNAYVINRFAEALGLHRLAAEDALNVPQRPKIEVHQEHLFVIARGLRVEGDVVASEQISFFIGAGWLLTFQERGGGLWQPIRERLNSEASNTRKRDASYLMYALLDTIVDHSYPVLDRFGGRLENLEGRIVVDQDESLLHDIHALKRELSVLRRVVWPMQDLTHQLQRSESGLIAETTRAYLRDVADHSTQLFDMTEAFREMADSLMDLHMSSVSNRMNEVMKVLTVVASVFIPVTFIAGVYGMNFEYLPELKWRYAYLAFWMLCGGVIAGMLVFFRLRGWIGRRGKSSGERNDGGE